MWFSEVYGEVGGASVRQQDGLGDELAAVQVGRADDMPLPFTLWITGNSTGQKRD
jgi:hypothetical protein